MIDSPAPCVRGRVQAKAWRVIRACGDRGISHLAPGYDRGMARTLAILTVLLLGAPAAQAATALTAPTKVVKVGGKHGFMFQKAERFVPALARFLR